MTSVSLSLFCQGNKLSDQQPITQQNSTQTEFEEFKQSVFKDLHELAHETEQYVRTVYHIISCYHKYYDAKSPIFPESEKSESEEES